ncbi:MAG: DUF499 domain-containing protein [Bacillota bacterium]
MKPLFDLCSPRESVFDETKRDDTLDLTNLIDGRIDVDRFIEETYFTEGMEQLNEVAFKRFRRQSASGIVKLTQAMGGGKTHSMILLGLLAMHPHLRKKISGGKLDKDYPGKVKVIAFTGRESDVPYGIWGSIADQLGKKELFKDYYTPLAAPGQTAWINLLKGEPLLILLDELPPYLDYARAKTIGNSDLSAITTTALSNLFTAINKEELSNVCLVISDLRAAYEKGSELLQRTFKELENEVNRSAINIEPVSSVSDEVYSVLKKRLFYKLPAESEIISIANAYKDAVREAKQIGYTNKSPEEIFLGIKDSYPFHPSIKDLYARFRENPGFQQTRGLIRFMRHVVSQLYSGAEPPAKSKYLIGVHDFDINDPEMFSKVKEIKPSLVNAITHDITSNGKAVAELIDDDFNTTITQDLAKLILVSSLADVPNALLGLSLPEIIGYLCAPGRDITQTKERLEEFQMRAWYLYIDRDGRLHFRHVKNINAEINSLVDSYDRESAKKEIRSFLGDKFKPSRKDCYQKTLIFPALDEINLLPEQVTLILTEPYHQEGGLHPDLRSFYADALYKNRVLFLTGQRNTMDNLLRAAKEYRAINTIVDRMDEEKVSQNDPLYKQATGKQDKARLNLLASARETFVTLHYPAKDNKLLTADFLMEFTGNHFDGEEQIRKVLLERRKLETDTAGDTFRQKCEERLFTRREMRWSEIKERAATNPAWQWHLPEALDTLKDNLLRKGTWRESGGYIEKPPFPKEKTTVQVQELSRNDDTGEAKLKIIPRYGDRVYFEIDSPATSGSQPVLNLNDFRTKELKLSFLCVDSTGEHETGEPVEWCNRITLKYRFYTDRDGNTALELRSAPAAQIRYTSDGSNPKEHGALYDSDFTVPPGTHYVLALAVAEKQGLYSDTLQLKVPQKGEGGRPGGREVDKGKPLSLSKKYRTSDTRQTYAALEILKKYEASISDFSLTIHKEKSWLELTADPDSRFVPDMLEAQAGNLREGFAGDDSVNITLEYKKTHFPSGQHFLDWVEENRLDLHSFHESEVLQ